MKKIRKILIIAVVSILALGIFKDQLIKSVVTVAATQVVGAPVHIDGLSLGVFKQSVRIKGFKIYNPPGFSKSILVDLAKINVAYDLGALFKKKLYLSLLEIGLKEMGLEKNGKGELNVDSLKVVKQGKSEEAKSPSQIPMQLDIVKLKIGKIVLRDYSGPREPTIKVYDINIDKSYKNITSAQQLAALILAEPMKAAGIQGAKIYGVAMLAGVAVLPVSIAATFAGTDSVREDFTVNFDRIFEVSSATLKRMGKVTREDKLTGALSAVVNAAQVSLKVTKKSDNKTEIVVSARKYFLPKPEIAGGVLYEISKKLK